LQQIYIIILLLLGTDLSSIFSGVVRYAWWQERVSIPRHSNAIVQRAKCEVWFYFSLASLSGNRLGIDAFHCHDELNEKINGKLRKNKNKKQNSKRSTIGTAALGRSHGVRRSVSRARWRRTDHADRSKRFLFTYFIGYLITLILLLRVISI